MTETIGGRHPKTPDGRAPDVNPPEPPVGPAAVTPAKVFAEDDMGEFLQRWAVEPPPMGATYVVPHHGDEWDHSGERPVRVIRQFILKPERTATSV